MRTVWRLCFFFASQSIFVGPVYCLATPTPPNADSSNKNVGRRTIRVVSTNKHGGNSKIFTFSSDTPHAGHGSREEEQETSSLGSTRPSSVTTALLSGIRSTFLPSGYPNKIPDGYLRYAAWSWVQDLSTQLRGVLATQRILEGVGVGREGATALSAMLNFLVRDGCGMAASLLFTASAASRFQSDVKKWRLFADIMVDIGITLEVAASQVPRNLFLPMICVGNVCKAMCGVAAGSVGGAINLYWAAKGTDISDISAKFGAQQTVTAALGLVFAAMFAKSISTTNPKQVWFLYIALTALHLFANARCMRILAFNSFNAERLRILFQQFYNQHSKGGTEKLSTPREIASVESLLFLPKINSKLGSKIQFGVPFNTVMSRDDDNVDNQLQQNLSLPYWAVKSVRGGLFGSKPCVVYVALQASATPRQQIQAYFHALWLSSTGPSKEESDPKVAWDEFVRQAEDVGWDFETSNIQSRGYEVAVQTSS